MAMTHRVVATALALAAAIAAPASAHAALSDATMGAVAATTIGLGAMAIGFPVAAFIAASGGAVLAIMGAANVLQ